MRLRWYCRICKRDRYLCGHELFGWDWGSAMMILAGAMVIIGFGGYALLLAIWF